jgi:hypothetical protein
VYKLSSQLISQGVESRAIALFDHFIQDEVLETVQLDKVSLTVLRLPSEWDWAKRFRCAQKFINAYNPEWLSLQFVPFSFQNKGLPFLTAKRLKQIGKGRKWHCMFHELWVGMEDGSSVKHRIWGQLQKLIILKLLKSLNPSKVHTQSKLYQVQLEKLNWNSEYLPLFSNIKKVEAPINAKTNKKEFSLVIFGTIHPNAPVEDLAQEIKDYNVESNFELIVRIMGRTGREGSHWKRVLESAGLTVDVLGEQPENLISEKLRDALIGISTTSLYHIEKSGTVAAMLDHGLPVLCVSEVNKYPVSIPLTIPDGVAEYKRGTFKTFISQRPNIYFKNSISEIAAKFTSSLYNL